MTSTKNADGALYYALGGNGHNGNEKRNLAVSSVGLLPDTVKPYKEQFSEILKHKSSRNKTECQRLIWSFSKDELPPDEETSALKALAISQDILTKHYSGFPAVICVQNDGKGGCLHVHAIVANYNVATGKGFSSQMKQHEYLKNAVDSVCADYIISEQREKVHEKSTQAERAFRDTGKYVWKDDLKQRIKTAMQTAKSRDDFINECNSCKISATFKTSKKRGEYILYELHDTAGFENGEVPQNLKAKSYKLGADYDIETLDRVLSKYAPVRSKPIVEPIVQEPVQVAQVKQEPIQPIIQPTVQPAPKIKYKSQVTFPKAEEQKPVQEPVRKRKIKQKPVQPAPFKPYMDEEQTDDFELSL